MAEQENMVEIYRIPKFDAFRTKAISNGSRYRVYFGGSGSGKTHDIVQNNLLDAIQNPGQDILCTRKTGPSLRRTVWRQYIVPIVERMQVPVDKKESEMTIRFEDHGKVPGSMITCMSLDDPQKVRTFEASHIHIEEATEFTEDDFETLDLRLRKPGPYPRVMDISYNPSDMYHWTVKRLLVDPRILNGQAEEVHLPRPKGLGGPISILHSTYQDNPYNEPDYIMKVESLAEADADYDRIYRRGLPGQLQGIIYNNWDIVTMDEMWHRIGGKRRVDRYGVDAGTANPMAMIAGWIQGIDIYLHQLLYKTGMTDMDFVEFCNESDIDKKVVQYVDPSRAGLIKELQRAGYPASPADNDVSEGIAHVKTLRLHITSTSLDMISEFQGYKRKVTRSGIILEDPLKHNDHTPDATRYLIFSDPIDHDAGEPYEEPEKAPSPLSTLFQGRYDYDDHSIPDLQGGWNR